MQNLCWLGESGTPCAAEAELKLWLAKPEKRRRDPSGDEKREQYKYGRTKALRATDQCCIEPAGLNSGISAAQNGASDWHCLAPHRHTSISLFLFFSSQFSDPPTHLTWHANVLSTNETGTYELTQSTTIFFHRFLVPTILTMHVFLGFFWRALCSSGKKPNMFTSDPEKNVCKCWSFWIPKCNTVPRTPGRCPHFFVCVFLDVVVSAHMINSKSQNSTFIEIFSDCIYLFHPTKKLFMFVV